MKKKEKTNSKVCDVLTYARYERTQEEIEMRETERKPIYGYFKKQ